MNVLFRFLMILVLVILPLSAAMADTLTAYFNNFDTAPTVAPGVGAGLSGITSTALVYGYSGLGPSGNTFGGNFLRNASGLVQGTTLAQPTTLDLTNLPSHTSININFLLGIIDSWDGYDSSSSGPDAFNVTVDGVSVFSQVFAIATGNMTYNPPSGVLLSSGTQLGFAGWNDNAYNMYPETAFQGIAHTGSSLTVRWFASGPHWSGFNDESWAIENVQVVLNGVNQAPLPTSFLLLGSGLAGLGGWKRFRRS